MNLLSFLQKWWSMFVGWQTCKWGNLSPMPTMGLIRTALESPLEFVLEYVPLTFQQRYHCGYVFHARPSDLQLFSRFISLHFFVNGGDNFVMHIESQTCSFVQEWILKLTDWERGLSCVYFLQKNLVIKQLDEQ